MSTISNAQAFCGLTAVATPSKTGVSGSLTISGGTSRESLPLVDTAYAMSAYVASSATFVLQSTEGTTTGSTTWVAGAAQVTAALAQGTITTTGNAFATVTAAGLSGSPLAVTVAVTATDTAAVWAAKAVTALNADAAVASMFTASATSATINLTRNPVHTIDTVNFYAATDATLNLKLANGTCYGITTVTTSTSIVAGTATSGAYIVDGDGNNFQGDDIATLIPHSILFELEDSSGGTVTAGFESGTFSMTAPCKLMVESTVAQNDLATVNIPSSGQNCKVNITVLGKTS